MDTPLLVLVAKLAVLFVSYGICLFLCVLLHELGHALAAWILTKQRVLLSVGSKISDNVFRFGRLEVSVGLSGYRYGCTQYDRSEEKTWVQVAVALMGPTASLFGLALGFAAITFVRLDSWWWIPGLAFFVANFRILLVDLLPLEYRPRKGSDEVWLSDSLDVWRMIRGKRS